MNILNNSELVTKITKIIYKSRLEGDPKASNFETVYENLLPFSLKSGEILVKSKYFTFEGSQRIWFSGILPYIPHVKLGDVMITKGIGEVIESNSEKFTKGEIISGTLLWQNLGIYSDKGFIKFDVIEHPLKDFFFSWHTSLTAFFGLRKIGGLTQYNNENSKKTIIISAACGATGISACQLAKAWGYNVAAIVSSEAKREFLKKNLDILAFSYKDKDYESLKKEISTIYPEGFDFYFDNVGGGILDMILNIMKNKGIIISCGSLSLYNKELKYEYKNMWEVILKRLKIEGFIVYDYESEKLKALDEIFELIKNSKFKFFEDMKTGNVELCPKMFENFYQGENYGKFYLKLSD